MNRSISFLYYSVIACIFGCGLVGCGSDDGFREGASVTPRMSLEVTETTLLQGSFQGVDYDYELISGLITGEVDPKDEKNLLIQDLGLASVNERGMVEYSAMFVLAKPKDMSLANGILRYDAPNRGRVVAPDPSFMTKGYVFLCSAWQGDIPLNDGRLSLTVPVAKNEDGSTITGTYRVDLIPDVVSLDSQSLPGGPFNNTMEPYAPASLDNTLPGYRLTKRKLETDSRQLVDSADWKFSSCDSENPFPGTPNEAQVCVNGGFDPAYLYELVYVAKNPKVMGLGLAALRDTVIFFRDWTTDSDGVENPVAGSIDTTLGRGISQCGNFLKTFIHLGFNETLSGSMVFDGVYSLVAARHTNINTRFATPGSGAGIRSDATALGQAGVRGLASDSYDPISGRSGGVMTRCEESGTCPKYFLSFSSSEYYSLQGSPTLTDSYGQTDLEQPDNVRIYSFASTDHLLGALPSMPGDVLGTLPSMPSAGALYTTVNNPSVKLLSRALLDCLEEWVVSDVEPPASQIPKIADNTLVYPEELDFPALPQAECTSPLCDGNTDTYAGKVVSMTLLDWGPDFIHEDETGIVAYQPPHDINKEYSIFVPQVDIDGNEVAGIRSLEVAVPLGTNTGWNYSPDYYELAFVFGSYFPFIATQMQREEIGDPRLSLEERYVDEADYTSKLNVAADLLVEQRFMRRADADERIEQLISEYRSMLE